MNLLITALNFVEAHATLILVLITIWYAWSTQQMVGEMRASREDEHERTIRKRDEQSTNLRTLLNLEIDQNFALLKEIRTQMVEEQLKLEKGLYAQMVEQSQEDQHVRMRQLWADLAKRLMHLPILEWRRAVWDAHPLQLAQSLHRDEIRKVHQFYHRLDKEIGIRRQILTAEAERQSRSNTETTAKIKSRSTSELEFQEKAARLWEEWKLAVDETINEGQPLNT